MPSRSSRRSAGSNRKGPNERLEKDWRGLGELSKDSLVTTPVISKVQIGQRQLDRDQKTGKPFAF
jgi:hypothetical protein